MRLIEFLTILCLSLPAGRDLSAQDNRNNLQSFANGCYHLTNLKMSNDGRWLTVRKEYNLNNDTVLIFNSTITDKPVGCRCKVIKNDFLENGILLIQSKNQAELFNLKEKKSRYFNGVKKLQISGSNRQFVLHYNKDNNNKLEVYDETGILLNSVDNVLKFYTTEKDYVFAVADSINGKYVVSLLKDSSKEKVYETSHKISCLDPDPDGQGVIVFEQNKDSNFKEVIYLDLSNKTCFPLKDVLSTSHGDIWNTMVNEGNAYLIKLLEPGKSKESSIQDIWYGNDNNLEQKFCPSGREVNYLWEPKKKQIVQIGNDSLTKNLNIGNDRYFLSFNTSDLNGYTSEGTPLKIYVFDRILNYYSVLDTVTDGLYLSYDGDYALSRKNKNWNLYNIPGGNKKNIPAEGLVNPWFTDDGEAVLFEGEGALWRYELKSGQLKEEAVFRGLQASIVNGKTENIATRKGDFRKQYVNTIEPLVIKLYDPQENMTSYVLWYKGKSKVVVPLTSRYIQFLNYNKSYDWFSWVEEDYNMPPQLVSKAGGRERKILYESNKSDKDILHLKQEIISYTNSDSVPLKGILYYPMSYNTFTKYPMVVSIYEKQRQFSNLYPLPSYYIGIGFNIRLLLEKGYFVYLPDIIIQGKDGAGIDALDCVNKALDAITANPLIDKQRIGLTGHSFGGYETNFIATHSTRFAAFVSESGTSDIIWAYHSFNYNFLWPEYKRVEAGQYKMGVSFSADKLLYLENDPVYSAEKVNAPVLLWAGPKDENIPSVHTMAFYNALRRNGKYVVALFYKDEGHVVLNPQAQLDLTTRTLDWFDYFLRGDTAIEWIKKGTKK
jgi:dienelactone hydrolase